MSSKHSCTRRSRRHSSRLQLETLESRRLLALVISEFVAQNQNGLVDEDMETSDWIEIHNPSATAVDLDGWFLTDDATELDKWEFPQLELDAGGFLTVFASNKDRDDASGELHTNFRLAGDGEYLGLVRPDQSIAYEFTPEYPPQQDDVSYGIPFDGREMVGADALTEILIPASSDDLIDDDNNPWYTSPYTGIANWTDGGFGAGFGATQPGFAVRFIDVNGGDDGTINNVNEMLSILDGNFDPDDYNITDDITDLRTLIDFGGDAGTFNETQPYLNGVATGESEDIAMRATAVVTIPEGEWTIGVGSDDGGRVSLPGVSFFGESNTNGDTAGDSELRFQGTRAHGWTTGQFVVGPGGMTTTLTAEFFERGGGDSFELAVRAGLHNNSVDSNWSLLQDGAVGWSVRTEFGVGLDSDLELPMRGNNTTALFRTFFTGGDLNNLESLQLQMQYADGFVAYLNGTEIARRNAPPSPAWDSAATNSVSQEQATATDNINISSFLPLLETGQNLLAIHGLNDSVNDGLFFINPRLVGGGLNASPPAFFREPTPGTVNSESFLGQVRDTEFSVDRGFYDSAFQLEISSDTDGAQIYFTLDGSVPSPQNGTLYNSPLTISQTTVLRAIATKAGFESSNVDTHSYIFLDDVVQQSPDGSAPDNFPPLPSVNGQVLDYGMDPEIVNHPEWGPQMRDALTQVKSFSIVTDIDNLFGDDDGIYANPGNRGIGWERPISLELLDPTGEDVQSEAGVRIRGGFSRSTSNPKHSFRLFFREQYGDAKFEYPLFEDEGVQEFDKFDLRTTQNYSWAFQGDDRNAFVRDVYSRDVMRELQNPYTRSRYVHLYLNGQYWGLYQTEERPSAAFAEKYFGGDKEDYDVVKSGGSGRAVEATDGNLDAYDQLRQAALDGFGNDVDYFRIQGMNADGTRNPDFDRILDAENLVDYMLVTYFTGDKDGPGSTFTRPAPNNFFGIYNRANPDGFKWFEHDSEHSLDTGDDDMVNPQLVSAYPFYYQFNQQHINPHWIHERLMANSHYARLFADRAYQHFFNDGVMTEARNVARVQQRASEFDTAIIAESARWGDADQSTPFERDDWTDAMAEVYGWFGGREPEVIDQFDGAGWWQAGDLIEYAVNGQRQFGGQIGRDDDVSIVNSGNVDYSDIVLAGSMWRYLDNGSDQGMTWREPGFDDTNWPAGLAQLGYGDGDEETVVSFGPDANQKHVTTYFRHSFDVADPQQYSQLLLSLLRDDGAVVYLNGEEVLRSNLTGEVQFDTLASNGSAQEDTFLGFTLPSSLLLPGTNVLAVEIHQASRSSSDISFDLRLQGGVFQPLDTDVYYTLENGVDPRTVNDGIAAEANLYTGPLSFDSTTLITARALRNGVWSPLAQTTFYVHPPASSENLTITEINYNPYAPDAAELLLNPDFARADFEFIEIYNRSDVTIDLSEVRFVDGIEFDFSNASSRVLEPQQRGVLVNDTTAFTARYGVDVMVLGEYTGNLRDSGEQLQILDRFGQSIQDFEYGTNGSWPGRPDGKGSSLELLSPELELDDSDSWRPSTEFQGSPGQPGVGELRVVLINEVLSHTDLPQTDSIELVNLLNESVDLGGWYLSDDWRDYRKFAVPAGTSLSGNSYTHFDEFDFNASGGIDPQDFALNSYRGEDLYLLSTDELGELEFFMDHVEFEAAANGESFGRWPNADGELYPMVSNTFSAENDAPRIGPLIISELMYNPPDPDDAGPIDANDLEFVEIYNPTTETVELSGWQLTRGIDFDFAAQSTLDGGQLLVVLSFNPENPDNAARLQQFRDFYGIDASVSLVGGYAGQLSNGGERVELRRPDTPPAEEPTFIPRLLEDRADFDDVEPWPLSPDGNGDSLTRLGTDSWGPAASSWIGAPPSPGAIAHPPRVLSVVMNASQVDPDDATAPSNWQRQRSDIRDMTITLDQPLVVDENDIVLTNLGVDPAADPSVVVSLTAQHIRVTGNTLTLEFAPQELTDGVYQLEILASATNMQGIALDGNGDGTAGDPYVLVGSPDNDFFRLRADFNGDRGVSIFDFSTFTHWFGRFVPTAPSYVDLNLDSGISIFDFPLFSASFGNQIFFPPAARAVSEIEATRPEDDKAAVEVIERTEQVLPDFLCWERLDEQLLNALCTARRSR